MRRPIRQCGSAHESQTWWRGFFGKVYSRKFAMTEFSKLRGVRHDIHKHTHPDNRSYALEVAWSYASQVCEAKFMCSWHLYIYP